MLENKYYMNTIEENEVLKNMVQNKESEKYKHAKRVDIVSIKMVKEGSVLYKDRKISNPSDAAKLIKIFLEDEDREKFMVCCLDTKNQINNISTISIGSLNSSIVHPREVFKVAIYGNSASVILFHNHPSGDVTPSTEDINVTTRLKEAGKILGIEVLDHLIIGDGEYLSLKEKGII